MGPSETETVGRPRRFGGRGARADLCGGLSTDLDAAILVVLHVPANGRSVLPEILERSSGLPAAHPRDREPMLAGHNYVAPPDRHLVVHDGVLRVTRGAWENADVLEAHERAAQMHERAARLHDSAAVTFDEYDRGDSAQRERDLANSERTRAESAHERAEDELNG